MFTYLLALSTAAPFFFYPPHKGAGATWAFPHLICRTRKQGQLTQENMQFDKEPLTLQYVVDSFSNASNQSVRQRELHIRADCTVWGLKVRVNVPCCNWTDVYGKFEVQPAVGVAQKLGRKSGVWGQNIKVKKEKVRQGEQNHGKKQQNENKD